MTWRRSVPFVEEENNIGFSSTKVITFFSFTKRGLYGALVPIVFKWIIGCIIIHAWHVVGSSTLCECCWASSS